MRPLKLVLLHCKCKNKTIILVINFKNLKYFFRILKTYSTFENSYHGLKKFLPVGSGWDKLHNGVRNHCLRHRK